ncbi:hypothetical protein E3E26_02625 [Thermococcus sp. LS1]|uniref:hypothetical protein n=1 Tax=Thermococcus sp. LS1 TaxID=1638259 RepID=UPI001438F50C|nr:hypothetical protein [Thermococcus sp. LS1]NJD98692.1 hypothetical protein [Thermococcus sp. LS1]
MKAFDAVGDAINSTAENPKIWRYPVIASGMAAALIALTGIGDDAALIQYEPDLPVVAIVAMILIALFLKLTVLYYPTKAFYYHKKGIPFKETDLIKESIAGGFMVVLVSIVYGIVFGIVAVILLLPAIIAHYVIPGVVGDVITVAFALPPALFLAGVLFMMIPAYIWTDDFDAGLGVIGTAWENKKETIVFGTVMLLALIGLTVAAAGIVEVFSWVLDGAIGALIVGLIDGSITGLMNVVSNTAGAAMYSRLSVVIERKETIPPEIDPDWLASL